MTMIMIMIMRKSYLGIWKAISSSESLGSSGARSNNLLGPRWIFLQDCIEPAVGWDWSPQLVPRCPGWPVPLHFSRFFWASAWRRKLCSRKKNTDISIPQLCHFRKIYFLWVCFSVVIFFFLLNNLTLESL